MRFGTFGSVQELNLPAYPFKLKRSDAVTQIYDVFRRKWVVLTPEEWVRQHMAMYLTGLGYVKERMAVEHELKLNSMNRRADLVAFDQSGNPLVLVECKAPEVAINQAVVDQAARYNLVLNVPCVVITNGLQHFCLILKDDNSWGYATSIPQFASWHQR